MGRAIIKVENLTKEYRLGVIATGALYKDLQSFWARIRGRQDPNTLLGTSSAQSSDSFLALNNITFDVAKGEILGIIGRNGAGKSTLLKILSKITAPSRGRVLISGRIGSLLEVGTGFHPELTGRENIFLNGAILGMRKSEIKSKLDAIIDFSGIEKFIDTPVKRYSSGMYVRLAFAVASHLDTEILLVDEVLAVGDAEFQKKCIGKMDEISKNDGRTVLFVSHNMGAVNNLCTRCISLEGGIIENNGPTADVIQKYLHNIRTKSDLSVAERTDRSGNGAVRLIGLSLKNHDGSSIIKSFDGLVIDLVLDEKIKKHLNFQFMIGFYDIKSQPIFRIDSGELNTNVLNSGKIQIRTGEINLPPGNYSVNVALMVDAQMSDYIIGAGDLDIIENPRPNVRIFPSDLATILVESEIIF